MKIVVDTNIFVSSFFGGNPRKIIDLLKNGQVTICLAPAIIEESLAVLRRLGLEGEPEIGELIDLFAKGHHLLFTAKTPELKVVHGDPADDKFIDCAVALKAEAIVSGDKRLQEVGDCMRIKILGRGGFLSLFSAGHENFLIGDMGRRRPLRHEGQLEVVDDAVHLGIVGEEGDKNLALAYNP